MFRWTLQISDKCISSKIWFGIADISSHENTPPSPFKKSQTATRDVKFECPLCDLVLMNAVSAREHINQHYPRDSHYCPVLDCGKSFAHSNSVRNHMRYFFKCPNCTRRYTRKTTLLRHMKVECGKMPTFHCRWCGVQFKYKHVLQRHITCLHQ
ncbi:hypothetical protein HHI36_019992 [Cryptolaemus montrouzieri]|uniref:C2H2-type domain-containing protein n=1 Tax=Cryptolaemus montrouzieri TaxID=559131 RepID=A0ABD2N966_9CUCU